MHLCPGTMTADAESINSDLQRGLDIYYESDSLQDLEKTINKELHKLHLWLNVNR